MKVLPLLLSVAALALLLATLLFLRGPRSKLQSVEPGLSPTTAGTDTEGVGEPTDLEPGSPLAAPTGLDSRAAALVIETAEEAAAEPAAAFDGPWSRVEGQVVDQEGAPLMGARVQLRIYRAPEGADLPLLSPLGGDQSKHESRGVEVLTDSAGRFALEAPCGSEATYWMKVAADRFHDSSLIRFGRDGVQALVEGQVDVGEIRLAATGSVFGTVTGVRGQPIADVRMDTGPGRATTYSRGSMSREDGSFVIPHAIVGTYMVKAELDGFLSKQVPDVTVVAGEDRGPINIVLEEAPRIEGRIVDEEGAPIEKVRLSGWPKSSGMGASARTEADGSFVVYLPQAEPYSLQATHPDYEQWGNKEQRDIEPGTHLGTITLRKIPQVSFTVADEASGESLSAFGIKIARNKGSEGTAKGTTYWHLVPVKDQPGGVFTAGATAKRDGYVAYAPGFLMQEGEVLPTEESVAAGAPAQCILLRRGAGVEGRLVANGEPVAGASLNFTPGSRYGSGFSPEDRLAFQVQSGPEGAFRTTGLPAGGRVRVTATRAGGGAPLVQMLEGLKSGEVRDLGDVEFVEGGTVVGKVVLPEGIDPGGITIYRGDWKEDINQTTDSEGAFRFEDVPAGENSFGQRGRPEILEDGGSVKALVEPGKVSEVTLDLRDQALVDVELEIDLGGRSAAGLRVHLVPPTPEGADRFFSFQSRNHIQLGKTDDRGFVRARCRAVRDALVKVTLPHFHQLESTGEPITIVYGLPLTQHVSFKSGSLVVDLGRAGVLPEEGQIGLVFSQSGGDFSTSAYIRLPLENGRLQEGMAGWAALDGKELSVHGVAEGDWETTVYASKKGAPSVETKLSSGSVRYGPEREFEVTSRVSIRAGETARM